MPHDLDSKRLPVLTIHRADRRNSSLRGHDIPAPNRKLKTMRQNTGPAERPPQQDEVTVRLSGGAHQAASGQGPPEDGVTVLVPGAVLAPAPTTAPEPANVDPTTTPAPVTRTTVAQASATAPPTTEAPITHAPITQAPGGTQTGGTPAQGGQAPANANAPGA